jgi:hypothetical protein
VRSIKHRLFRSDATLKPCVSYGTLILLCACTVHAHLFWSALCWRTCMPPRHVSNTCLLFQIVNVLIIPWHICPTTHQQPLAADASHF